MILVSIFIPVLTVAILLYFFKKYVTTWEWISLLCTSLLVLAGAYFLALEVSQRDTEYYGGYVRELRYYEPWNERVMRSREVPCGTDGNGHTKYCTEYYWETVWHPKRFEIFTNLHEYEIPVSEEVFETFKARFAVKGLFVDMHRHYYTKDGDAYYYIWDARRSSFIPYSETHKYKNPLKYSNSLFKQIDISKDSAQRLGLYEYPDINAETYYQPTILGITPSSQERQAFDFLNGYYGKRHEIRVFFLAYTKGQTIDISELQKCYWQGGNKNELVVCVGVDSTRHVIWSNSFSWCDAPWLEVESRQWFSEHDSLDLVEYSRFLEENIPTQWKRKKFSEFSYIRPTLPFGWKIGVVIITLVFCGGFAVWLVRNDTERRNDG